MLLILEEIFLLALDEEKGSILPFTKKTIPYALSGAILAELALQGKVCSNDKHRLEWVGETLTGDNILDEALQEIQAAEKARKLTYWIGQFSDRPKKFRERLGERLVEKKVLYQEDKRLFPLLASDEDAQPAASSKFEIKTPLRAMVLANQKSDPRSLALLSVMAASELLNLIFSQDELEIARRRIHEKVIRAALENPAMQTTEEIEQAVASCLEDETD